MSYQGRKNSLHDAQERALREKLHEHDIVRNAELRKFRREQLLQRQNLEKVLLTEVRIRHHIYLHVGDYRIMVFYRAVMFC